MKRFDRYWIGIILGLLLPALFIYGYIVRFDLGYLILSFGSDSYPTLSRICMLSVLMDMALIFVFYTTDTWRLSKGVLLGSFPYIIASIALTL